MEDGEMRDLRSSLRALAFQIPWIFQRLPRMPPLQGLSKRSHTFYSSFGASRGLTDPRWTLPVGATPRVAFASFSITIKSDRG